MKLGQIKFLSFISIITGCGSFLCGLFFSLSETYFKAVPFSDFDFLGMFLVIISLLALFSIWPCFIISQIISIVVLCNSEKKRLPLTGLILSFIGIFIFLLSYQR